MYSPLHEERLDTVMAVLRAEGVRSVADLGCGSGNLVVRLLAEPALTRIVAMDASAAALRVLRSEVLNGRIEPRCTLIHGSYTEPDAGVQDVEAITLIETIEHLDPKRLGQMERTVLAGYAPRWLLITTPNADYNPRLGLAPGRTRDADHKFEWGRIRFRNWARGLASRHGYDARFLGIGEADPDLGAPTQMVVLSRHAT
jgi:small RNA 2'-O-methyltransferase